MQNYAKFFAGGVEPKPLGCNGLGQLCQACCKISQKCYIRTLYALDLLPVPLGADGKPLTLWERPCHEELLRIESAFEQPDVQGIGVQLWRRRVALDVEDLGAFLRWLRQRGLQLLRTTTIEHPKGWTLLYWLEGGSVRGVRQYSWGRLLGHGAVVAVPDTEGYRYLAGLEGFSPAPAELVGKLNSYRR